MSAVDACALLTPAEIQQALGVPVKPGVEQRTESQSECQWDSRQADAVGAGFARLVLSRLDRRSP